ncbi:MAG: hypothetical protein HOD92_19555 [Deltaproteobacteria bacterium]|nr:hypothetical protein [Deltaproteobacteria bacterium]
MHLHEIITYIELLAMQLEKLLKVINHSDPTAASKKVLLYNKYQENLELLVNNLKTDYSWQELQHLIKDQPEITAKIESENKKGVIQKITKDLEKYFIEEHVLPEFTASNQFQKSKKTIKKPIRKNKAPVVDKYKKHYTKESILDMVQMTHKQVAARSVLKQVIAKFNQINPDRFESKINEFLQKEKK